LGIGTKALEESTGRSAPHDVRAIVEEAAELAAWTLAAGGLLGALVARAGSVRAGIAPERHTSRC
jgi:hypothetical protein